MKFIAVCSFFQKTNTKKYIIENIWQIFHARLLINMDFVDPLLLQIVYIFTVTKLKENAKL